jgi:hypothetical protein
MNAWKHTDADFTLQELADTIAWLMETNADFDPIDTENLNPNT